MGYRLFTIGVFLFVMLLTPASGTEFVTLDETWWNGLDESHQVTAVQAANQAYTAGYSDAVVRFSALIGNYATQTKSLSLSTKVTVLGINGTVAKESFDQAPYFSKTFGTYVHGVSDFYANHPGASSVNIGRITSCLAEHAINDCDRIAKEYANNL